MQVTGIMQVTGRGILPSFSHLGVKHPNQKPNLVSPNNSSGMSKIEDDAVKQSFDRLFEEVGIKRDTNNNDPSNNKLANTDGK
ncbi:hypothetical protein DID76_01245 [Candidatus Marinamargulisbacteria bacterium SCGC AG-414-C22]|nr:hypothetical protein DID76_01245 [Candidatus Marinamargulisbacteria bacterium SCGC AG-414-C22]